MLQKDLITIDRQEAAVELKDLGNGSAPSVRPDVAGCCVNVLLRVWLMLCECTDDACVGLTGWWQLNLKPATWRVQWICISRPLKLIQTTMR